jgi:hypothetical protein
MAEKGCYKMNTRRVILAFFIAVVTRCAFAQIGDPASSATLLGLNLQTTIVPASTSSTLFPITVDVPAGGGGMIDIVSDSPQVIVSLITPSGTVCYPSSNVPADRRCLSILVELGKHCRGQAPKYGRAQSSYGK